MGIYHWVAIYSGDANNITVSSGCAAEPVTIGQATPTIATTPSPGGPDGTSISDTATVTGGFIPTGTVTFNLFPPGNTTCAGTPVFTSTNPLSGGSATSAPPFATTAVGDYHWVAIYDGDANNTTVSSACEAEPVTIGQATPTIATTPSAGGPLGTPISDTATVTGGFNPTGTVTFELFPPTDATCTATPVFTSTNPLSGGSATSGSFTTAAVGTYHWVATYNGDTDNTTASSDCTDEPVTIGQAPQPMVTKTVTSNTQNPNGTWTIVYDVAVTNPNASIETSFTLTDALAFGHNIDVNWRRSPEQAPAPRGTARPTRPSWPTRGSRRGATEHYTVTVNATVLADATASDRTCAAGGGFLNTAQVALPTAPTTASRFDASTRASRRRPAGLRLCRPGFRRRSPRRSCRWSPVPPRASGLSPIR